MQFVGVLNTLKQILKGIYLCRVLYFQHFDKKKIGHNFIMAMVTETKEFYVGQFPDPPVFKLKIYSGQIVEFWKLTKKLLLT